MKNLDKTKIPFCDFQKKLMAFFEVKPKKELSDKAKRILHTTLCVVQLADVVMSALYFLFDKIWHMHTTYYTIVFHIIDFLAIIKLAILAFTFFTPIGIFVVPIFVFKAICFHFKFYIEIEQKKWKLILKLILMIIISLIEFPLSYFVGYKGLEYTATKWL